MIRVDQEKLGREEIIKKYQAEIKRFLVYIPWLEKRTGSELHSTYSGNGIGEHSVRVPVYDATLLRLVRELEKSTLMDKNYAYVYTRNHIKDYVDEWDIIQRAKLQDYEILFGILSKYVLKGRTKSTEWTEAVENQIFLRVFLTCQQLFEIHEGPLG